MNQRLYSKLLAVSELKPESILSMYRLFEQYFDNCQFDIFISDLNNKQYIIQLFDTQTDTIQGFTTLAFFPHSIFNKKVTVVYSGDTIVSKPYSWTNELSKSWIRAVRELTEVDSIPVYWLLICSGYRTYRFLPVFFKEFFPRYDIPTPEDKRKLMNEIANKLFKHQFMLELGIVRFQKGTTFLKKELVDVDLRMPKNPHKNFFFKKNPGYIHGDELVCLTEIDENNFTAAAKRMLR